VFVLGLDVKLPLVGNKAGKELGRRVASQIGTRRRREEVGAKRRRERFIIFFGAAETARVQATASVLADGLADDFHSSSPWVLTERQTRAHTKRC
jgi:hypothetical protein